MEPKPTARPGRSGPDYSIHQLAELAGVTTRTLRYYDQIGLLPPASVGENGYRSYGPAQVRRLQQILFYRALGMECRAIAPLLDAPPEQQRHALERQLDAVRQEQQRLDALAGNLQSAIAELKGECVMKDAERFEGLKRQAVEENERQYGAEARRNYGDTAVDEVNARVQGMTEEQWQQAQELSRQIAGTLRRLAPAGDPAGPEAAALADLHRRWLCCYWGQKRYSAQAHRGLARMYLADARFCAYYDAIVPGGTAFLCAAIENHIR
ncbi:MerR family transcriptional regulator [bacterium]|nr:MerR family transcriptional regulator [bacterium]